MNLPNIDGLTARVRRENKSIASVIVVNRGDWGERQRFTIAHELGHMVLDVTPKIDAEKAAHRFAGAFLMPAETLRAKIGKYRISIGWGELFDLKRIFGVSVQALAYRCKDLGSSATLSFGFSSTNSLGADGGVLLTRSPARCPANSLCASNACAYVP